MVDRACLRFNRSSSRAPSAFFIARIFQSSGVPEREMTVNLREARRPKEVVEAAAAYDVLAPRYENLLSENPVIAHSARVSLELVSRAMSDRAFLLEIGSGIGRETLELAERGKRLVACDPSEESLR